MITFWRLFNYFFFFFSKWVPTIRNQKCRIDQVFFGENHKQTNFQNLIPTLLLILWHVYTLQEMLKLSNSISFHLHCQFQLILSFKKKVLWVIFQSIQRIPCLMSHDKIVRSSTQYQNLGECSNNINQSTYTTGQI